MPLIAQRVAPLQLTPQSGPRPTPTDGLFRERQPLLDPLRRPVLPPNPSLNVYLNAMPLAPA